MRKSLNVSTVLAILGIALFGAIPVMAHHCEESAPGVTRKGSYDHGKKYGIHTCAPRSNKLTVTRNGCISVIDKDGNASCN